MLLAVTEDRAMPGSDLSADVGLAKGGIPARNRNRPFENKGNKPFLNFFEKLC